MNIDVPLPQKPQEPEVGCAGGCGTKLTEQQAEQAGWERLPITGRMRCGACTRWLQKVSQTIERLN